MRELVLGLLVLVVSPKLVSCKQTLSVNPADTCDALWKVIPSHSYLKHVCSMDLLRNAVATKHVLLTTEYGTDRINDRWWLPVVEVYVFILKCPSKPELSDRPVFFKKTQEFDLEETTDIYFKTVKEIKCNDSTGSQGLFYSIALFFIALSLGSLGYVFYSSRS